MLTNDDAAAFAGSAARGMYLAYWAERIPGATALLGSQGRLSFAELNARANRLAHALRARGVQAGDALALLCHNSFELVEVIMATRRIGVRLTPINYQLSADEVTYILNDCDAKVFIASARFAAAAQPAAQACRSLELRIAADGAIKGFERLRELVQGQPEEDVADPVLGVNMLYTSGSTGRPKGVERPSAPPITTARSPYTAGNSLHLCTGPLYHAAPLAFSLIAPLLGGAGVVLMDGWDAERSLQLIEENCVTHTHMVPTMFHRLLALPSEVRERYDLSSLEYVLHGAAPCPVPVKHALIAWLGPVVYEYYGATEGLGTIVDPATWLRKPGTVGKPEPADQIRILDAAGESEPANKPGLVYLKAPDALRFRYYKDTDKTLAAFRGDYFTLGDVGYLDEDGYLFLTDRSANLIISGGVNIYPAEADAVLLTHPAVQDVAVIGIPNPEWGEEVKAAVELRSGVSASDALKQELIDYCRAHLAHYKCPRSVDFFEGLPRKDTGKLSKYALREQYRRAAEAK
jgi:long-chain acyl-CoA synthetase